VIIEGGHGYEDDGRRSAGILHEHIPYRLAAIDLCQIVARILGDGSTFHTPILIQFGSILTIRAGQPHIFTNPVVEHGFMSCRAMLEFLGVGGIPRKPN
jgi:hypothetical protein